MAKDKETAESEQNMAKDKETAGGLSPHLIQIVTPTPKPADPIPDFDKTVPGGRYVVNGRLVDAHNKPIPEGREAQDPAVLATSVANAEDLSRLPVPPTGSGPA